MLFPLLISLLVVATLALFTIGALLIHQQRVEQAERSVADDHDPVMITLGDMSNGFTDINDQALAKLQLELQARRQMADIIG